MEKKKDPIVSAIVLLFVIPWVACLLFYGCAGPAWASKETIDLFGKMFTYLGLLLTALAIINIFSGGSLKK